MYDEDREIRYFKFVIGMAILSISCILAEFLLLAMRIYISRTSIIPAIVIFSLVGIVAGLLLFQLRILSLSETNRVRHLFIKGSLIIAIGALLALAGYMIEQFALSFY
jgi:hypothetical protein